MWRGYRCEFDVLGSKANSWRTISRHFMLKIQPKILLRHAFCGMCVNRCNEDAIATLRAGLLFSVYTPSSVPPSLPAFNAVKLRSRLTSQSTPYGTTMKFPKTGTDGNHATTDFVLVSSASHTVRSHFFMPHGLSVLTSTICIY